MHGPFQSHYRTLAHYNGWANGRLYAACAALPEAEYFKPRPAFFGSIHGTLNHLLVVDRLWLARLEGGRSGIKALDQQLYGDFAGLQVARVAEDAQIIAWVEAVEEPDFARAVRYRTMAGAPCRDAVGSILMHLFNHHTHHRGQAHDLLSQTAVAPPPLDLIYFTRETAPSGA